MRSPVRISIALAIAWALAFAGCGNAGTSTTTGASARAPDAALRAGVRSVNSAASHARGVLEHVAPTAKGRARLANLLVPLERQTSAVIDLLQPTTRGSRPVGEFLAGAREQRRFLQFVIASARNPSAENARRTLVEAAAAAASAVAHYNDLILTPGIDLAGDLPTDASFDTSALELAINGQG